MKKLIVIDASAWMYRAYFGKTETETTPVSRLNYLLGGALNFHQPDESVVAFDHGRETFRNKIYPQYKATRKPPDEGYVAAVPDMKRAFEDAGFRALSVEGYEADDIIGTLCAQMDTYLRIILSRDKDLMQLVADSPHGNHVHMCHDGKLTRDVDVVEKFGVYPESVRDVLGLMGDSTDNIPGVSGIGPKIASKLIEEYGCLENLYQAVDRIQPPRIKMLLKEGKENAFLSRELATIKTDVPLGGL